MLTGQAKKDYQRECEYIDDMDTGYIYLLQCEGTPYYKIGMVYRHIEKRIKTLQTGCPYRLLLVYAFRTVNPTELEHKLHELFKSKRVSGEWFELDTDMFAEALLTINPMLVGYVPPVKIN